MLDVYAADWTGPRAMPHELPLAPSPSPPVVFSIDYLILDLLSTSTADVVVVASLYPLRPVLNQLVCRVVASIVSFLRP